MRRLLQTGLILCLVSVLVPTSVLLGPGVVQAETFHENETISTNTVWAAGDSPHIVSGSVQVNEDVTLTIEPGCDIRLNSGAHMAVHGTVNALGTGESRVTFTSNDGGEWSGLRFYSGSSGDLDYCTAEYSTYGVYASSPPFRLPFS